MKHFREILFPLPDGKLFSIASPRQISSVTDKQGEKAKDVPVSFTFSAEASSKKKKKIQKVFIAYLVIITSSTKLVKHICFMGDIFEE